ncbi:hypothetical protein AAX29_01814 [Aliarcobacter thereius]|uniref:Uncharacterized protein n=1 Tax=Aliarcobacter thereius TaxID=544718 RepID=A0A1C0B545_9BACT|nr:tetratricopeptide repeat protein [Aliarcobacter thereius]OCL97661.1 hypothetical protein AAX29_01814 [Aliarcobacter thereius]
MKKIILCTLITCHLMASNFGFSWDDREITNEDNFIFEYKDYNNYAYLRNDSTKYLFDIFREDGDVKKVKVIFFDENTKMLTILVGATNTLKASYSNSCDGINSILYNIFFYKIYNNFPLKILLNDIDLTGHDGELMCQRTVFPYKTEEDLRNRFNKLEISKQLILNSLIEFLKSNYSEKYNSLFTFKESSFNLETLKLILNDIPISQKALTQYNDIAYYLHQADANEEAIFLLEKIIEKYPNRIVAYLNLADAYIAINDKEKAKKNYKRYVELMKQDNKEEKIPKRVLEFLEN